MVQGVGFRPFVKNLADEFGISGSVTNRGSFVEVEAESGEQTLTAFLHCLRDRAPARSAILRMETRDEVPLLNAVDFLILESRPDEGEVYVSPDLAICDDCRRELFDPENRRYLHPFINCTACGPRLTILDAMPYDRERTSMARFAMCPDCEAEYTDPQDRRYHAQPVCCPDCGPRLYIPGGGENTADEALRKVRRVIREGGIAAIKGIGGFHLCCNARDESAVRRLRRLKNRPGKPFAVMAADMETARRECKINAEEALLLDSAAKPILLLNRREGGTVCESVAPGNPTLGLMLPYAPVQLLLFGYPDGEPFPDLLVMTSGNVSGAPICRDDEDVRAQLSGICDIVLSNDREIRLRADDSVTAVYHSQPYMIRRSRGFAPLPVLSAQGNSPVGIFAAGGELKNTFCLVKGGLFYLSPYVGNLSDARSLDVLDDARLKMERLVGVRPAAAACDLHPGYHSAAYAESLGLPLIKVQHHFAHIASCMAENGLTGEVIGVAFDGTGWGADGAVWGGEFLKVSYGGFERLGHLSPFELAGGDRAAEEGFRPALSLLLHAFGGEEERARAAAVSLGLCPERELDVLLGMLKSGFGCAKTTSAGRLFDAVSALLGVKSASTFEGEAAMALEFAAAGRAPEKSGLETRLSGGKEFEIELADMIQYLISRRLKREPVEALAGRFHSAAAEMILAGCRRSRELTGLNRVALSGGCFQNLLLLGLCEERLRENGFEVYRHGQVPPNDGGIALGQAAIALEHFKNEHKPL